MKQFFIIVFGGLAAIGLGWTVVYGSASLWNIFTREIADVRAHSFTSVATALISRPADGTSVSGLRRMIRYSASEEEDLINAAEESLPLSADSRVSASGYIVKNLSAGGVVATAYNRDKIMPIASLTKLITAAVARKLIDPEKKIIITKSVMVTYGNTAQFKIGEIFRAKDLYYPLLMVSSNDSAEAFAESYGRAAFIKAMNEFAQSIGAYRTYFADPSGLSPNNVSTANDFSIILDWIRKNDPDIISVTNIKAKTVKAHTWINPSHFLNWSNYLGGKNGYTTEANRTSAGLFSMGPRKNVYAVVIFGSNSRDADVVKLLEKVRE